MVTPFLPGDSLLFAVGALAARPIRAGGHPAVELVIGLLLVAAILGDAVNYAIGHYIGPRVFRRDDAGLLHSSSTASTWRRRTRSSRSTAARRSCSRASCRSCARSCRSSPAPADELPPLRDLQRRRRRASGSALLGAGYVFGNVPIVKKNFSLVMLGIIVVSVLPAVYEFVKHRRAQKQT